MFLGGGRKREVQEETHADSLTLIWDQTRDPGAITQQFIPAVPPF